MQEFKKPQIYKDFIDNMVEICNNGQGTIESRKILNGVWNKNLKDEMKKLNSFKEDFIINEMLKKLNQEEKEILAKLFKNQFIGGVFETLKYLEEFEIEPFIEGYEGSPFHDFIGRVDEEDPWEWPE